VGLKYGFTLVELLVVIAILGIVSAAVLAAINPAEHLRRARDARRKQDIAQIRGALMNYSISHGGMYPPAGACALGTNCYVGSPSGANWLPALTASGELPSVPIDPKNSGGAPWNAGGYTYYYGNVSSNAQEFDLVAQLESTSDADRCGLKNYRFSIAVGGGPWCTAFGGAYSNQLYERSPRNGN